MARGSLKKELNHIHVLQKSEEYILKMFNSTLKITCPRCWGTKQIIIENKQTAARCPACDGNGKIPYFSDKEKTSMAIELYKKALPSNVNLGGEVNLGRMVLVMHPDEDKK